MQATEKRRAFIIRVLYVALVAALVYVALKYAMPLFLPFLIAFLITFILKPVIAFVVRKTRLKRKAASILVLTLFYLVVGGLLVFVGIRLGAYIWQWLTDLPIYYTQNIEPAFQNVMAWIDNSLAEFDPSVLEFFNTATESVSNLLWGLVTSVSSNAVGMASSVGWFVVGFFLAIIASYFFVVDYYKITGFIARQLSDNGRRKLFVIKDYVTGTLLKFARAYLILMFITFCEMLVGMFILRVDNPFGIALLTAIVDILPVFGTGTVMLPWAAYCLFTGDIFLGVGLLVVYAIITAVRQVLEPRVVGKQIGLYPLLTLICMFIGTRLFGIWGLLGFPVAVTVLVHLNREGEINLFKE